MATTKRPEPTDEDDIPQAPKSGATIQDRIAAFAMLDAMEGRTQAEKTMRLRLVGFTNTEISAMLQTTPGVVASSIYSERKKAKKPVAPKGTSPEPTAS